MLCRERREISLTVLLVNCHDVTGRIFDRRISHQMGMKNPLKWHKQPGRIFRKSNTNPGKQFGVSKCLDSCGPDLSF